MSTGDEFAILTHKKLVGFEDFGARGFDYVRELCRVTLASMFGHGAFSEKMPVDSVVANTIRIGLKPTLLDGLGHDGDGHILDLEAIMTGGFYSELFVNPLNGDKYTVGAAYHSRPSGVAINPRTGLPEYVKYVEGIGDEAEPDLVTDNGNGTITFRVNSLVDPAGGESIAGRQVRVFKKVPGSLALTEPVAIETLTASFDGTHNTITTVGTLGQPVVSVTEADYLVQLIGLSIRNNGGSEPLADSDHHFLLGSFEADAAIPTSIDNDDQGLINTAASTALLARAAWADGTLNPPTDLQNGMAKIVTDLTSTSGGRGAAKLTSPAVAGTRFALTAARLDQSLSQIMAHINGLAIQTVFNVMDPAFGAVGNNVADDTTAINNAFTAAAALGGIVFFPTPPVKYRVTSLLTVPSKVSVIGTGASSAVITMDHASNTLFEFAASTGQRQLADLGLETSVGNSGRLLNFVAASGSVNVLRCNIGNGGNNTSHTMCLSFTPTDNNISFRDCEFYPGQFAAVFRCGTGAKGVTFDNCYIKTVATYNPADSAMFYGERMRLDGVVFDMAATSSGSFSCYLAMDTAHEGSVSNCIFRGVTGAAVVKAINLGTYGASTKFHEVNNTFSSTLKAYEYTVADASVGAEVHLETRKNRIQRVTNPSAALEIDQYGLIIVIRTNDVTSNWTPNKAPEGAEGWIIAYQASGATGGGATSGPDPATFSVDGFKSWDGGQNIDNQQATAFHYRVAILNDTHCTIITRPTVFTDGSEGINI